jgi:hypothetical protein
MKQNQIVKFLFSGVFSLILFFQASADAGAMFCNSPDPANPDNFSVGADCMASIDAAFILAPGTTCTGPFLLVARTLAGDTIVFGTGSIAFDASAYINDTIEVRITDTPTGNFCSSYFWLEDKTKPTISCPHDTVACTAPILPANVKPVVVSDGCDPAPMLTYFDAEIGPDCAVPNPMFIGVIIRSWMVSDSSGNTETCSQHIYIERADTMDVDFPPNDTLDCSAPNSDPSITGHPSIDGNPIVPVAAGGRCNIHVTYMDEVSDICLGNDLILRHWTVLNECTSEIKEHTQVILIEDITVPTITCPAPIIIPNDTLKCSASFTLPLPIVTDDCSGFYITAEINGVDTGFTFVDLPVNNYLVTYTATDSCGNFATCQVNLNVIDNETPAAVCTGPKQLSLPSNGVWSLAAGAFNAGSTDNCGGPLSFLVSRDGGVTFNPSAIFDCNDAGTTVMVMLRVTQVNNPTLSNICMTTVNVLDKQFPIISCPAGTTIDCESDYSNLAAFGSPMASDNCSVTVTADSMININNCGVGMITRIFTAKDPSGNSTSCTQKIMVINQTPYSSLNIKWPKDTTFTNLCAPPNNLGPDNLPANYNKPVVTGATCAMIATNYQDQLFYIAFPACYKIVRKWTVIDWCMYNPAVPGVGIWTDQQIIAVMDGQAPVITACPPDSTYGVNASCTFSMVNLAPVTATDCSQNVTITNNSPYATANGANASGNYPPGVHHVKFTVKDGCGNESTCTVKITIADLKKPTPYCRAGIRAELGLMNGMAMVPVPAKKFDKGSFDNCTAATNLQFTIRLLGDTLPPTASELVFGCSGEGMHKVEMWVTDQAGNKDYCITDLEIQDNMSLCPDTLTVNKVMIAGAIDDEMGKSLPGVNVQISNVQSTGQTNATGGFEFDNLPPGASYTITPQKNNDPLNGVTTFDLVLMSRHILNVQPLTSPYKRIAADVNRNGVITTSDVVELRKLILQMYTAFPNNTSWRFVKKDYVFPVPENPFAPPFPEVLNVTNLSQDVLDANFVGVKIGDLNCSASTSLLGDNVGDRSPVEYLTLTTEDTRFEAGDELLLPIQAQDNLTFLAYQFSLEFETDALKWIGFEKGALPGVGEESFGLAFADDGILTTGWFNLEPQQVHRGDALFNLRFRAIKAGNLSDVLSLNSRYTKALAYDGSGEAKNVNLEFSNPANMSTTAVFQLYQNQPNPFKKTTQIGFNLPEAVQAKLTIYDLSGRVLKSFDNNFDKGYNKVSVERTDLPGSGVLFYKLETPTHTATKKMILLN